MIRGSSVAESGETGARSGWFVALSGKSALSRGSLVAHSGHLGEICTLMIRGSVGAESGGVGGGVGAIRSTIGYIGRSRGTILSSRNSFGTDKQDSNLNGRILGPFLARSGQIRCYIVLSRG